MSKKTCRWKGNTLCPSLVAGVAISSPARLLPKLGKSLEEQTSHMSDTALSLSRSLFLQKCRDILLPLRHSRASHSLCPWLISHAGLPCCPCSWQVNLVAPAPRPSEGFSASPPRDPLSTVLCTWCRHISRDSHQCVCCFVVGLFDSTLFSILVFVYQHNRHIAGLTGNTYE